MLDASSSSFSTAGCCKDSFGRIMSAGEGAASFRVVLTHEQYVWACFCVGVIFFLHTFWQVAASLIAASQVWRNPSHSPEDFCVFEAVVPHPGYEGLDKLSLG